MEGGPKPQLRVQLPQVDVIGGTRPQGLKEKHPVTELVGLKHPVQIVKPQIKLLVKPQHPALVNVVLGGMKPLLLPLPWAVRPLPLHHQGVVVMLRPLVQPHLQ